MNRGTIAPLLKKYFGRLDKKDERKEIKRFEEKKRTNNISRNDIKKTIKSR